MIDQVASGLALGIVGGLADGDELGRHGHTRRILASGLEGREVLEPALGEVAQQLLGPEGGVQSGRSKGTRWSTAASSKSRVREVRGAEAPLEPSRQVRLGEPRRAPRPGLRPSQGMDQGGRPSGRRRCSATGLPRCRTTSGSASACRSRRACGGHPQDEATRSRRRATGSMPEVAGRWRRRARIGVAGEGCGGRWHPGLPRGPLQQSSSSTPGDIAPDGPGLLQRGDPGPRSTRW